MRRFGLWTIAAGVWAGGAAFGQDTPPVEAHGAVAGGVAILESPVGVSGEAGAEVTASPGEPELPVAVGISAGVATFLPGSGGGVGLTPPPPPGGGGGGSGGGGSGGGGGGGTPIMPAESPSFSDGPGSDPAPTGEFPTVGGPETTPIPVPMAPPAPPGSVAEPPSPSSPLEPELPPPPPGSEDPPVIPTDPVDPVDDPTDPPVAETPEPGTLLMAGMGAAAVYGWRRRRRK